MFYEPRLGHGLKHNPFGALIVPRPIAWVSTRDQDGSENLAPYSFFNGVSYDPPQIMIASTSSKEDREIGKDTVSNTIETGEFCINMVGFDMLHKMNMTSFAVSRDISEFDLADVDREECKIISVPRVRDAPASLECKLIQHVDLPGENNIVVFGEVVGIHLNDEYLSNGVFDITKFEPVARLGYLDYAKVSDVFSLKRPK